MKKGMFQLSVQIDYDEMINEKTIDALHGFTGKGDFDSIAQHHFAYLGKKLEEVLKNLPFVKYDIKGNLIPLEQLQPQEQVVTVTPNEELVEEPVAVEAPVEEGYDYEALVATLNESLENVSVEKGMPQKIIASEIMIKAIQEVLGVDVSPVDGKLSKYHGFELQPEGMEELFMIEYKDYQNGHQNYYVKQKEGK